MRLSLYLYVFFRLLKNLPRLEVIINCFKFELNKILKKTTLSFQPVSIIISATKRCNFACDFCFVEKYMSDSNGRDGDLTDLEFESIMSTVAAKKALRIGFLGGEPFLNKNIFKYIEILHKQKKITSVVTNSALLKGDMLAQLQSSSLDVLGLSLYDNNIEDIKRVASAIRRKKRFWVQTVVDTDSIHTMESKIILCLEIECKELIFDNYYPKTSDRIPKVIYSDNFEYINEKKRLKEKYKNQIYITWVPLIPRQQKSLKKCLLPLSYIQLDNKGNIGPCCVRAPDKIFGNIYSSEGWNSKPIIEIRESLVNQNAEAHEMCKMCQCLTEDLYQL